jgi:hypothetical protein
VRALLVLIKRQVIDNAIYFALALVVCAVLIIAVTILALTEDRTHLSLYALALMVVVPVFFCAGSYTLGLLQTHGDRNSGVAAVLALLPAAQGRVFLARLVVGVLVILTALGPLAIVGAVLWKFLGPPAWLLHGWLAETFAGMALTAFGCYCLGLGAGQSSETITRGLRALPLTFVLLLLIVIKGFGWPLLVVLVPYLGVSLLLRYRPFPNRFVRTAATGLMALVLLAVPLSLGRYVCDGLLACRMDAEAKISPLGLLSPEIENDPNVEEHSAASAGFSLSYGDFPIVHAIFGSYYYEFSRNSYVGPYLLENSGIIQYFQSRSRGMLHTYRARGSASPRILRRVHLDEVGGQLVCHREDANRRPDEFTWKWHEVVDFYAGPGGVFQDQRGNIGRFESPVVYFGPSEGRIRAPSPCVVYDKKSSCFFAIDFESQTVRKGPEVQDSSIRLACIGPSAGSDFLSTSFYNPSTEYGSRLPFEVLNDSGLLSVVEESGRIDVLDLNTLELSGPMGYLPRPQTPVGWGPARPRDLLEYDVLVLATLPVPTGEGPITSKMKFGYLGSVTSSLSQQGTSVALAIFDRDGNMVNKAHTKADFFKVPWGPAWIVTKGVFESLHPPVLTLASYFTAYSFEARSTHRALFLMPNSFVAMARDYEGNVFYALLIVALLMAPGFMFACVLAWRVDRDAARFGLSPNARRLWLLGTLAFGLAGYITYRLTRPQVTLVTCANCGHPRRPDVDQCHRCASPWHVPELTPPAWRVLE